MAAGVTIFQAASAGIGSGAPWWTMKLLLLPLNHAMPRHADLWGIGKFFRAASLSTESVALLYDNATYA